MAEAKISSDRWVLDADLEGQKEEQNFKVSWDKFRTQRRTSKWIWACKAFLSRPVPVWVACLTLTGFCRRRPLADKAYDMQSFLLNAVLVDREWISDLSLVLCRNISQSNSLLSRMLIPVSCAKAVYLVAPPRLHLYNNSMALWCAAQSSLPGQPYPEPRSDHWTTMLCLPALLLFVFAKCQ